MQSVVRNVSDGETLVNGQPVSVAALAHGDVLSLGGRSLRWLYDRPDAVRPLHAQPGKFPFSYLEMSISNVSYRQARRR